MKEKIFKQMSFEQKVIQNDLKIIAIIRLMIQFNFVYKQKIIKKAQQTNQFSLLQIMLNKKPDTIQGFLSPTKLLSGSKPAKYASKGNRSPDIATSYQKKLAPDSKYNSQNQSYLNTSRDIQNPFQQANQTNFSRLTGENKFTNTQLIGQRKYQSQANIPFSFEAETKSIINYTYNKNIIAEEDQPFYPKERTLEEINNQKYETVKNTNERKQYPFGQSTLKNDQTASFKNNLTVFPAQSSQGVKLRSGNLEAMTVQCYELIRKLSKIKQNLEQQISQLQTLLDNTSKYMQNMDLEFQRIKGSILSYTARSLDNAFTQYKQNMVQWSKYEDFQRKSLAMISQINKYIYNQQQKLSENKKLSSRQLTATAQELEKQIDYYRKFTEEINKIRKECIGMRPTLTEDRVKQFEKGLAILCNF